MNIGTLDELKKLCMFNDITRNYNFVLSGGASGRQLISEVANAWGETKAKVWLVDVDGVYQKRSLGVAGCVLTFDLKTLSGMNPFGTVEDFETELDVLKHMLACLASPAMTLNQDELMQLEKSICVAWSQKKNQAEISDVTAALFAMSAGVNSSAYRLAAALFPYTREGEYGHCFTGPANMEFLGDFVVIDLAGLCAKKDLQAAVLMVTICRIIQEMSHERLGRRKVAIVDGALHLLQDNAKGFVESVYRHVRHYGGGIGMSALFMEDFSKNDATKSAYENADWIYAF